MSNVVDRVFNDVCLDERVKGGIFKLEEEEHMNALRDYFIKRGISNEAAIHVTNRMVEGRFPERQAYNKDGILVTFPTPKHKAEAIRRGTHFEKNPAPQNSTPPKEPAKEVPEPKEKPLPPMPDKEPEKGPDKGSSGGSLPKSDSDEEGDADSKAGEKKLEMEPPRGSEKPEPPPAPTSPVLPTAPRTPERIAAEKEVAKQIFNTDDTTLTNLSPDMMEACRMQLNELYKRANELGYREAVTFLTPYVKS